MPFLVCCVSFWSAFPKLRKATVSFVPSVRLSVCPSVRVEQLRSHWTDFHEILYLSIFRKSRRENSSLIKIGQEQLLLYTKTNITFSIISHSILIRMRNVSDESCRENQNTHFMFDAFFFSKIVPFMR